MSSRSEAQDRLVRYLNDAASVERELAGLLQMLADASDDPVLRTEFEQHRKLGEEQRGAYEARVRALGGEPVGDRRMLGQLVARLWEALEKPRTTPDRVETLLKALALLRWTPEYGSRCMPWLERWEIPRHWRWPPPATVKSESSLTGSVNG